jgi:hypothetical protein
VSSGFEEPPFLDSLIGLKTDLSQAQTAGWTPGPPVHAGLGHTVHADQMIPVAGGVALAADVTTPKVAGDSPAVVAFAATVISCSPAARLRVPMSPASRSSSPIAARSR